METQTLALIILSAMTLPLDQRAIGLQVPTSITSTDKTYHALSKKLLSLSTCVCVCVCVCV